jgi:hypothetical protein
MISSSDIVLLEGSCELGGRIPGAEFLSAEIYSGRTRRSWLICDLMQKESDRNFRGNGELEAVIQTTRHSRHPTDGLKRGIVPANP